MPTLSHAPANLFLQACGTVGPLELSVESPAGAARPVVPQPFALVGRVPQADVFLDHPEVSARHAYLQAVGGRVLVLDLHSRTGTRWADGARPAGWLRPGDAVGVGPFALRLAEGVRAPETGAPLPGAEDALPRVRLEFDKGGKSYPAWDLKYIVALVGRSEWCRVRLKDASVSRVHCSLVRTPQGVWAVDLLGRGGIAVGGVPVRFALLGHGAELRVGDFLVRCVYEAPPPGLLDRAGVLCPLPSAPAGPAPLLVPAAPAALAATGPAGLAGAGSLDVVRALAPLVQQFATMQQMMFDQFHQALGAVFQVFGSLHGEHVGLVREELRLLQETTRELQDLYVQQGRGQGPAGGPAPPAALPPGGHEATGPARPRPNGTRRSAEEPPAESPGGRTPAAHPPDAHAWVQQRVAALEQERQTRWQRIVGYLLGKAPESKA